MLHYKPRHDKDNTRAYLPDCCDTVTIDDPKGCDCCADNWSEELKVTTRNLKEWSAITSKLENLYTLRVAWRDRLKLWYDDMTKADERADDLLRQLELFINHLNKICLLTEKTSKAIGYLFCMVEDLYARVDKLKDSYDDLMACINAARKTHPELDPASGIVKCLEEYGKKLLAVTATRDAILKLLAESIELVNMLHEVICLREDNCGKDKPGDYGLINVILYWRDVFNGTENLNNGKCKLDPFITLPIDESEYYKYLWKHWDETKKDVVNIKKELDEATDKRNAYQACKESLEKALAEVSANAIC